MNIALCIDKSYFSQCKLLIYSIIKNNKSNISFHIFSSNLSNSNIKELQNYNNQIKKISTKYYDVSNYINNSLTTTKNSYLSIATFYRLYIEKLISPDIKKILYLDCDMIVTQCIKALYETNIEKYSIAAVPDINNNDIRLYNRLNYNITEGYFNAGMLLINLEYWRKNNISQKALSFIAKNPEKCILNDQDALNYILHGTIKFINAKYNVITDIFKLPLEDHLCEKSLFDKMFQEVSNPCIIHYAGGVKPWMYEYTIDKFPFKNIFKIYEKQAKINIKNIYFRKGKDLIKMKIKYCLAKLHFCKIEPLQYFYNTEVIENNLISNI